jgi:glycosyltransferase involved in cell wall biosynthesis
MSIKKRRNSKKQHIVHVINDLKLGGAQKLVSDLILNDLNTYVYSIILIDSSDGLFDINLKKNNVKVFSIFPLSFKNIFAIIQLLKKTDLIHVHLFPLLYLFAFLPIKKIFTEHNTWNRRRNKFYLRHIERIIYSNYNAIVSISNQTKILLNNWLNPIPAKNSLVVFNGVDSTKFTHKAFGILGFRIGMMGRFSAQKDQETILRALQLLPKKYQVILAGSGEKLENTKTLSKKIGVSSRTIFTGQIDDINTYLNKIDIYVQSSHWEGFGLAPLEAMSKGIPTIGSNVDGLNEVIGSRKYLFEKNCAEDLAQLILDIYEDDSSYVLAQKYALAQSKKFSLNKTSNEYKNIYNSIIKDLSSST